MDKYVLLRVALFNVLVHQLFYEWYAAWCCEQVRCTRNCIMCENRVKVNYYKKLLAVMRNLRIVREQQKR